ncbi:hypothetical protein HW49_04305 [Porphyromonadaceae bacterium COT-184 OH4590]|nr:hypothetical protein HW49_04305 [Porphyromonadaceae bacterium COT-184 OH4590]
MEVGINIYALDSWNYTGKNSHVSISRVSPQGMVDVYIGKTYGKRNKRTGEIDLKGTVNIGLECLNLRVGR